MEELAKRLRDIIVALLLLPLFFPFALAIAFAIKLGSPGPVLFIQKRVGYQGRLFTFYKFRTMRLGTEEEPSYRHSIEDFRTYRFHSEANDPRLTCSGRILRVTTMDETPQLLNVIKGDMSLVGPRPELPEIVAQYPPEYHQRHGVKPGMTGLAAVMGRSDLTYHQTMEYDLDYVRNHSFWRDLWILYRTVGLVLSRKGAQ